MENHCNMNKHTDTEFTIKKDCETPVASSKSLGLLNFRALIFLILWYIFSGCTLFLNKYILTYMNGNPTLLGKDILNEILFYVVKYVMFI